MEQLTPMILSQIVLPQLQKGLKITKKYVKEKLSDWLLEDDSIEKIEDFA